MTDRLRYKPINYASVDINNVTDDIAQHICINDTIDIIVTKDKGHYLVRVLDVNDNENTVDTELIGYEDYSDLLGLEE